MLLVIVLHGLVLHSLGTPFLPSLADDMLLDLHLMCLFLDKLFLFLECHVYILLNYVFAHSYRFWHVLFNVHSHVNDVSFLNGSHTSVFDDKNFPMKLFIPKMIVVTFYFLYSMGAFLLVHAASLFWLALFLWISPPQRMVF